MPIPASWSDKLLAVLRIVAGLAFLQHGTSKFFGLPPFPMPLNPLLYWANPPSGQYDIWVGTSSSGDYAPATLFISVSLPSVAAPNWFMSKPPGRGEESEF